MCTYNGISSHTDRFEIQKRDSEEILLTFVNLFPRFYLLDLLRIHVGRIKRVGLISIFIKKQIKCLVCSLNHEPIGSLVK